MEETKDVRINTDMEDKINIKEATDLGDDNEEAEGQETDFEPEVKKNDEGLMETPEGRRADLCRLLVEGSRVALRSVFNSIHPPIHLRSHLAEPDTVKTLRRLRQLNVLSPSQWDVLYPVQRKRVSSQHYDACLLTVLLQHVCHLSPPYPNGWNGGAPFSGDLSIAAGVVRITELRARVAAGEDDDENHEDIRAEIEETLMQLGGVPVEKKLKQLSQGTMPSSQFEKWPSKLKVGFSP